MQTIDDIYENIGHSITNSITVDNWTKAQLALEVIGNSIDFKGYLNENERFDAPGGFSLTKSILIFTKSPLKAVIISGIERYLPYSQQVNSIWNLFGTKNCRMR
jgi:hypothetical protein